MDKIVLFTQDQGNFLIRLLLAHIIADFVLQTTKMVENKKWFSIQMGLHILIVFLLAWIFSSSYKIAIIIAISHWLIDSIKVNIQEKVEEKNREYNTDSAEQKKEKLTNITRSKHVLFIADQLLHLVTILAVWCFTFDLLKPLFQAILSPFNNYKTSLYILAYALAIWPLGYLIKFALQKMVPETDPAKFEHGGKLIGQFERIIILTFVLLGQYEAIGFLITGKSIIRFASTNENLKSEYVLLGTMMSYSLSIIIGVATNWLILL